MNKFGEMSNSGSIDKFLQIHPKQPLNKFLSTPLQCYRCNKKIYTNVCYYEYSGCGRNICMLCSQNWSPKHSPDTCDSYHNDCKLNLQHNI